MPCIAGRAGPDTGCGNPVVAFFFENICNSRISQHGAWETNDILVLLCLIISFIQGGILNK